MNVGPLAAIGGVETAIAGDSKGEHVACDQAFDRSSGNPRLLVRLGSQRRACLTDAVIGDPDEAKSDREQ